MGEFIFSKLLFCSAQTFLLSNANVFNCILENSKQTFHSSGTIIRQLYKWLALHVVYFLPNLDEGWYTSWTLKKQNGELFWTIT